MELHCNHQHLESQLLMIKMIQVRKSKMLICSPDTRHQTQEKHVQWPMLKSELGGTKDRGIHSHSQGSGVKVSVKYTLDQDKRQRPMMAREIRGSAKRQRQTVAIQKGVR